MDKITVFKHYGIAILHIVDALFCDKMCKITHKEIRLCGAYIFQDHKVIFKHFSKKICHFQGRLKNQALFKTVVLGIGLKNKIDSRFTFSIN